MKVIILTEGGEEIGIGHIMRCTAIYEGFIEKNITPEIIANIDEKTKVYLKGKKHRILNWLEDKKTLFNTLVNCDVIIIDSYLADSNLYSKLTKNIKICVFLDDNRRLNYSKGIVINPTVNAEKLKYPQKKEIKYLLGSKYIPLRKEFWIVPKKKINENVKNIMVTFGGNDFRNLCPIILNLLIKNYPNLIKNVIVGRGYNNIDEIEHIKDNNTNLIFYPDAEKMREVMSVSDLAISAGGQTLFELACMGVPTIAICLAINQVNNIEGFESAGLIKFAGWYNDKDLLKTIIYKFDKFTKYSNRKRNNILVKKSVDGQGARRVAQKICELYE